MEISVSAKIVFGAQLKKYRVKAGLTQGEFADLHNTGGPFINLVENGKTAVSIDLLEAYAATFGVEYYEMGNPKYRIPSLRRMPEALHEYIAQVKEARKARKLEPGLKITAYLDPIIDSGFLKTPKTARMIAEEIERLYDVTIPPGRITAELTKPPRNEKVKIVDRPEGRTEPGNWYQRVDVG